LPVEDSELQREIVAHADSRQRESLQDNDSVASKLFAANSCELGDCPKHVK
jgi:hypothetical protein